MKRALLLAVLGWAGVAAALDHPGVAFTPAAARRSRSDTPYQAEGTAVAERPPYRAEGLPVIVNGKPVVSIEVDSAAPKAVHIAAANLAEDFRRVCGTAAVAERRALPSLGGEANSDGSEAGLGVVGRSLRERRVVTVRVVPDGRWEAYTMTVSSNGIDIVGSDRRGAVYGIYELSEMIGVSPWYWWADVPVVPRRDLLLRYGTYTNGEPKVKYRGLFINDEWPSFGGWTHAKFGGFNAKMYAHLFELLLRLRANYLWPAMWSAAFGEDDPENQRLADDYGIVMGTSHHEPMMRAHKEYTHRREAIGPWNYETNRANIESFFREGLVRAKPYESLVTIGMRGDGDVAMGNDDASAMRTLAKVIAGQRAIIKDVYGAPDAVPQLWAIFTEVQRYYDAGFTVPDDVTLLFCDNNWGYLRRIGTPELKARKGGAGLYYHIDMNGGPWNDRWVNTTTLPKLRHELELAYKTGLDRIWIINVGDLKPKEVPIDFILHYAWNPDAYPPGDEMRYLTDFAASFVGPDLASETAQVIADYSALNLRRKPEVQRVGLYDEATCRELDRAWQSVADRAEKLRAAVAGRPPYQAKGASSGRACHPVTAAFFELVYYPAVASTGVAQMYLAATLGDSNRVDRLFARDRELERQYNEEIAGGKWKGMMKDVHIGYTQWSMPKENVKPEVNWRSDVPVASEGSLKNSYSEATGTSLLRGAGTSLLRGAGTSLQRVDAPLRSFAGPDARWEILPGLGNFGAAIGSSDVTAPSRPDGSGARVDYAVEAASDGPFALLIGILPTQDIAPRRGLRLGVRLDGGPLVTLDARQGLHDEFNEYTPANLKRNPTLKPIPPASRHPFTGYGEPMRNEVFDDIRWLDARFPAVTKGRHTLTLVMIDPEVVVERLVTGIW